MTGQLAPERPPAAPPSVGQVDPTWLVVTAAAARGVAVAASGLILAAGLALLLWAVTPASGPDSGAALRGGVAAFAAANLMPISIGDVTLTLPPLLFTVAIVALLAITARRGRFLPEGRYQETIAILTTTAAYGLVVAAATRGFGPPGTVPAAWVWTAPAIALVAVTAGTLRRGSSWRDWWAATAPEWAQVGVRGGAIGFAVMIAGGALALSVSLVLNFGTILGVSAVAAPSWTDGLGMTFLGLTYLPNAVVAGVGYISGVGFEVGAGTYSPLSTVTVDLPAIPLLAAAPDQHGRSWVGLAFLIMPAIAAVLIARPVTAHLFTRSERTFAAATGAVLTGGAVTAIAAIARGGIGDGNWSVIGSPPLLLGGVLTLEIAVIAIAIAALTGGRTVPWRSDGPTGGSPRRRLARRRTADSKPDRQKVRDDKEPKQKGRRTKSRSKSGRGARGGAADTGAVGVEAIEVDPSEFDDEVSGEDGLDLEGVEDSVRDVDDDAVEEDSAEDVSADDDGNENDSAEDDSFEDDLEDVADEDAGSVIELDEPAETGGTAIDDDAPAR